MDNKLKYDFQRMCRICLSESSDTTNLFDSSKNIYEIIMTCSDVKLRKDDGLPAQICNNCSLQADNAFSFKQQCEQSDAKLRYYLNNSYPFPSNEVVKEEHSLLGLSDINDYFKYESHSHDSILASPSLITSSEFNPMESFAPKYECAVCKCMCCSSEKLVDHVLSCHSGAMKTEDTHYLFCSQCKRKFSSDFDLKKHEANHKTLVIEGKKFYCPICRDNFLNHESLLRHLCYHLEESDYKCEECKCYFTSKLHLKRHNQRRHYLDTESKSKSNAIFDPDLMIKSEDDIAEHNLNLTNSSDLDNDLDLGTEDLIASIADAGLNDSFSGHEITNECDLVDSDYDANKFLSEIMDETNKFYKKKNNSKRKHCNNITIKIDPDSRGESYIIKDRISKHSKLHKKSDNIGSKDRKRNRGKVYSCVDCSKKFNRSENLKEHQKRHTGERSYLCSKCGKGYFKQSHLDKHMLTHLREHVVKTVYSCPLCSRVVKHSNHLQAHMRTHKTKNGDPIIPQVNPNKVSHLCSTCGRSCSSRSNLAVHMRRHLGTKTCICKICGKGYPRTTDLTLHMRQHTGERPFICTVCNRAFARSDKLAIHMRTHTGEKPYSCSVCGRSFAQSNDLASHKKRNTCSSAITSLSLSNDIPKTEDHLLLLSQNSQLQVTPVEIPLSKSSPDNRNQYKVKRKKNIVPKAINLATNSNLLTDEDKMNLVPTKCLGLSLTNNHMFASLANTGIKADDVNSDCEAAKNVSDIFKHGFSVPELVATQRAIEYASGNQNNVLAHQRTELTDFTTAALLQLQSAHFGLR